jgi:hypothetical protein
VGESSRCFRGLPLCQIRCGAKLRHRYHWGERQVVAWGLRTLRVCSVSGKIVSIGLVMAELPRWREAYFCNRRVFRRGALFNRHDLCGFVERRLVLHIVPLGEGCVHRVVEVTEVCAMLVGARWECARCVAKLRARRVRGRREVRGGEVGWRSQGGRGTVTWRPDSTLGCSHK